MNILVIGGAGYIGSHMCRMLESSGHKVVVYDNLSSGHIEAVRNFTIVEGCLGDKSLIKQVLENNTINAVMHFAAHIEVGESVLNPSKYYNNNFCRVVNLLDQMIECGVKYFIFSSTAAVYGNPLTDLGLKEDDPCLPINPYGKSKLMVERLLEDYGKAYGLKYTIFRYFNASGADDSGEIGESHNPETHLIPLVLRTAKGERESINIFGTDYDTYDGTCIRDFIHVNDLAKGHILGLERMLLTNTSETYNLGNGKGFSVKDIITVSETVTGVNIRKNLSERRAGDPAVLIADISKASSLLRWQPEYNLQSIIKTAWNWEINKKY